MFSVLAPHLFASSSKIISALFSSIPICPKNEANAASALVCPSPHQARRYKFRIQGGHFSIFSIGIGEQFNSCFPSFRRVLLRLLYDCQRNGFNKLDRKYLSSS